MLKCIAILRLILWLTEVFVIYMAIAMKLLICKQSAADVWFFWHI